MSHDHKFNQFKFFVRTTATELHVWRRGEAGRQAGRRLGGRRQETRRQTQVYPWADSAANVLGNTCVRGDTHSLESLTPSTRELRRCPFLPTTMEANHHPGWPHADAETDAAHPPAAADPEQALQLLWAIIRGEVGHGDGHTVNDTPGGYCTPPVPGCPRP